MELKVTFLGRTANRWRVRVDLPAGAQPRGLTVGLWGEDGRPISPAVVASPGISEGIDGAFVAELGGPAELPPGTRVRAFADLDDGQLLEGSVGVHRRTGLHAYLHGDLHLKPLAAPPEGAPLRKADLARLARVHPWMVPVDTAPAAAPPPAVGEALHDPILDMLRADFDVDVDDMDDDLVRLLRR